MAISRCTRNRFMRAFVKATNEDKQRVIRLNCPALVKLRARDDYANVLHVLISLGLIRPEYGSHGGLLWYALTNEGQCYFEKIADERRKFLLHSIIVPILISIITTAVTVYILPPLGRQVERWLSGTSEPTQQSLQESSPTYAPSDNPPAPRESPAPSQPAQ